MQIDGASGLLLCNHVERIVYKLLNLSEGAYKRLPINVCGADKEHGEWIRNPLPGGPAAHTMFDNEVLALLDTRDNEHVVDLKGNISGVQW